ncbi:SAM-dependent methyltransferase [Periweissella fabalis]|uniref:SAM-dependent methyltransferase n=1 Tax=Periweissella fabalis TaxID=1070421 RepID=A0A7X6N3H2_9LACO|nr:SAM-dependent methyltransferase [Periweissella fabalis]MCM0599649.1 SAM-dependent methyltransferase [Periweissella fabalis]NKZ23954.1 SAM-dependent methyltransferase [Periweissella fabalis]
MQPKKLKKLKKQFKPETTFTSSYLSRIVGYQKLYDAILPIKLLLNHILNADHRLQNGLEPQPLPPLLLPDNIQDVIYEYVNQQYAPKDPRGDALWELLINPLADLDHDLRDFRDYLSSQYGMWAYTNAVFLQDLSTYLAGAPVLEIMAGNGYISAGLRARNSSQLIYTTDDTSWLNENATGKHPVTTIEPLDALAAIDKYGNQVAYVIMSWSPDGLDIDWQVLQKLRTKYPLVKFLVIGEKDGATNSTIFWQNADLTLVPELNVYYQSFDLINEQVYLVK